uniref:Thiamin pyrophosphokinase 1 (inferred by orthology to a C. elegans protein) n=1 Tax=Nippostrongylus brasiliensis TaxID=27835 RepID=A0A0N4XIA1_NIPBR
LSEKLIHLRPIWIRLWNRAEKRYCTDGGANRVVNQELAPPEVVVGDMDSIMSTVADGLRSTTLLVHAPDQDKTDLTKCLEFASRVLLLGGTSGRLDHALAAINSLYNATALLNQKVYCLDGENFTFVLDEASYCTLLLALFSEGKYLRKNCL